MMLPCGHGDLPIGFSSRLACLGTPPARRKVSQAAKGRGKHRGMERNGVPQPLLSVTIGTIYGIINGIIYGIIYIYTGWWFGT